MNTYTIGEFSKLTRKSIPTLQRWDRENILIAKRTKTNRRYYTHAQYLEYCGLKIKEKDKKVVVYCRVSSNNQKQDLLNQVKAIELFCLNSGIKVDIWYKEIGSALNYKRKFFNEIMNEIEENKISKVIIAHKDRLVRFGFDFFKEFIEKHESELLVINQESLSPQEEVVNDLMTIIHCFSSRLYGLRNYKSKIKEIINVNRT